MSNVLKIAPRSIPNFKVRVNSEQKESLNVCYGSNLELSVSFENDSILKVQGILDLHPNYIYINSSSDTIEFSQLDLSNFMVTDTILVKSYLDYCGEKIYSSNSILVRPYDDLLKDLSVVYGDCMVRGERASIHINSPKYKESNYGYVFIGDNQNQIDTVLGVSCNNILLPEKGSKSYSIFVKSDVGCMQEKEFRIENSEMDNPLLHSKLTIEMQNRKINTTHTTLSPRKILFRKSIVRISYSFLTHSLN